jgi:hypothetical protein
MLPERQGVVKQLNATTKFQATCMGVYSLSLTALVFTKAQSTDLRASLLFAWLKPHLLQEPPMAFPGRSGARAPDRFVGVGGVHSRRFIRF